jgi:hypothetical protein
MAEIVVKTCLRCGEMREFPLPGVKSPAGYWCCSDCGGSRFRVKMSWKWDEAAEDELQEGAAC